MNSILPNLYIFFISFFMKHIPNVNPYVKVNSQHLQYMGVSSCYAKFVEYSTSSSGGGNSSRENEILTAYLQFGNNHFGLMVLCKRHKLPISVFEKSVLATLHFACSSGELMSKTCAIRVLPDLKRTTISAFSLFIFFF